MAPDPQAVEAAVAAIEEAFAGLTPPGDEVLLHPLCMDDGDIAAFYGAPDWRDLPEELLIRSYAAPAFFSAAAFRYYIPAFMLWSLRHAESPEYLAEATLRAFNPGAVGEPLHAFQASKYALFDAAQRRAVVAFLEFFTPDDDLGPLAEAALRGYWA